ncbi:MAG: RIP metalloprotease RseP [Oligoflexia bacterium]|nr:RIP metalloprotease RseP [Oligoflexia bacterium]
MLSVLGFLIILGPLVVVHELGHYIFARIFGVKAEAFSVGFGPKLWARQIGETEWRFSAIPLGGYVKLLGEDREAQLSPEEQKRALHKQAAWKRFFIFFGGPLFNFLFAILVFMVVLLVGEPQVASVVGRVVHGSAAERAGFQSGDRILSVNGKPVRRFEEVAQVINDSPGKLVEFAVVHPASSSGKPVSISATPIAQSGYSIYGENTHVGEIDGLMPAPRSTLAGVSDPASVAAKAGIKTGDQIVEVNGSPVSSWEHLEDAYAASRVSSAIGLKLKRSSGESANVILTKPEKGGTIEEAWGMYSSELFVDRTVPGSPAEAAGLRKGDRLIGVGDRVVQSFFELKDGIQKAGETTGKVRLRWEHEGRIEDREIVPTGTDGRDIVLNKTRQFTIGVVPMLVMAEPEVFIERTWNPFMLLYKGTERMVTFSWRNLVAVGKMITGDVSVNTIGGPILIGKIAGESLARGLHAFLSTMAILSIGLGVLNILPVPVLDGGHLLLLGIEAIRGRPLTMRQMEIIQGVGLILILALMGLVIHNDISRLSLF